MSALRSGLNGYHYLPVGCHLVAALMISGKAASAFFRIPSRLCPAIGCSTMTRAISGTPWSLTSFWIVSAKAEVAMVTVGIPFFSRFSWSTTSQEVQAPQSAGAAITRSGLSLAILPATSSLISPFFEIRKKGRSFRNCFSQKRAWISERTFCTNVLCASLWGDAVREIQWVCRSISL
jgi:hypothetical protein